MLAFTNERAGVPAEGVRAVIRFPAQEDIRVWEPADIPESPDAPERPKPPRPRSPFDIGAIVPPALYNFPDLNQSLGALRDVRPQGNVSPPTITEGSTTVEFQVKEVLHNLHEDTRDHPLMLMFNRAGTWAISYEVHARNLPQPRTGTLTLVVTQRAAETVATDESIEPPENS